MDFQNAGIKHLLLKKNIRALIDGKEDIDNVKQLSHKDCELSKWLYNEAIPKHGRVNDLVEFETLHIEIHMVSNRVIYSFKRGDKEEAEQEYKNLEGLSKKLITMLTAMSVNYGD